MANLGGNFDASQGDGMGDRSALPAGEYVAAITETAVRVSKKNESNSYVNVTFQVMEGEKQGQKFWTILNLWNNNATAVDIAERELRSICRAVGRLNVTDTEELHGIPMLVKLKVKDDRNEVASYAPMPGAAPNAGAGQAQGSAPQQNGGGAPWRS